MRFLVTGLIACCLALPLWAQSPCGLEGEACETSLGTYRIELPDGAPPEGGYPALIFFHGAGGTGLRTLRNRDMVETFTASGYAVIGPDGLRRPNSRFGPGWSFHPERPKQRDERAFTASVIADAVESHGIDSRKILLSGFSIGGSLVWYLACEQADLAAAYAPVAGAFWRPHPAEDSCDGPVRMLHTHGWRDQVVPLEGRPLRGGQIYQGDVFYGLMLLRQENACEGMRADAFDTDGPFWRRIWTTCSTGSALELALHEGGHAVPAGWADMAIDWFEALNGE